MDVFLGNPDDLSHHEDILCVAHQGPENKDVSSQPIFRSIHDEQATVLDKELLEVVQQQLVQDGHDHNGTFGAVSKKFAHVCLTPSRVIYARRILSSGTV